MSVNITWGGQEDQGMRDSSTAMDVRTTHAQMLSLLAWCWPLYKLDHPHFSPEACNFCPGRVGDGYLKCLTKNYLGIESWDTRQRKHLL